MSGPREFAAALSAAMRTTYRVEFTDDAMVLWFRVLESSGIGWPSALRALELHMGDTERGRFAPTPADLIGKVRGTKRNERDALEAASMVAWGECLDACRRYGTFRAVSFDDPRTMTALAAIGGWPAFGVMTDDGKPSMLAAFRRAYCGAVDGIAPALLPGIFGDDKPAMIRTRSATIAPALPPAQFAALPTNQMEVL